MLNVIAVQQEEIQRKTATTIANMGSLTIADRNTMAFLFITITKLSLDLSESNAKLVVTLANCNQLYIDNLLLRSG